MSTERLNALANLLMFWLMVAPSRAKRGVICFDLREFQNYAAFLTKKTYSLQEVQEAALHLASFRLISPIIGWPTKPDEVILRTWG